MSQNDYVIANQSAPDFRADLNDALQALASLSSGSTAPTTTYANMLWYDTANNILKMRSEADDAWIDIGTLNQSTNEFEVAGLTTLPEAAWETGTDATESLVSPAKVKAAIDALAETDIGAGTAALSAGDIGTYVFAYASSNKSFGDTVAGSDLTPISAVREAVGVGSTNASFAFNDGSALTGTWRCMGEFDRIALGTSSNNFYGATLWLRIA